MANDLQGRTFLVTGATAGIGLATAAALAGRGGQVVLTGRDPSRTRAAVDAVRRSSGRDDVLSVPLDLASLASVREAATAVGELGVPLHVLVANAGQAGIRGLTTDGFELAFGTNHLGHFLLTTLLLDQLRAASPSRVVVVASQSHEQARGIEWDALRRPTATFSGMREYGVSKLCNVLFARELARREAARGVTAYSVHPGVIASEIWKRVPWPVRPIATRFMRSTEDGARTSVHCATAPGIERDSGAYFSDCAVHRVNPAVTDDLAADLWRRSEAWVAQAAASG